MAKRCIERAVLIDDSEIDLFIQKRFLEVAKFCNSLEMYTSANEAFNSLKVDFATPPEAIFLDLNMPDGDGFTFLKRFSDLPPAVSKKARIIVLTSSHSPVDRDYVLTFKPVIHFLTKTLKNSDIEELRTLF